MDAIEIRRASLLSETAGGLIDALNAELLGRYPEEGATHFRLDSEEVRDGRGTFVIAYAGDAPVGCGAVRLLASEVAELKRMYVTPSARGRRIGEAIVRALETEARRLGVVRLVLETGERQPESLALYARCGFRVIDRFGEYVDSALSVCMGKDLA